MKYYSYNTVSFRKDGSVINEYVETLSEAEILKIYWDWWKEEGIKRWGKEHFEANYSEKDCIEDWIVVHWARETTV
jgi:hypothetical protein